MLLLFLILHFKYEEARLKMFLAFLLKLIKGKREEISSKIYFHSTIVQSLATRTSSPCFFTKKVISIQINRKLKFEGIFRENAGL